MKCKNCMQVIVILIQIIVQYTVEDLYTGWPRKNATLTINNFKKTKDRMKKLCALLRMKFLSQ